MASTFSYIGIILCFSAFVLSCSEIVSVEKNKLRKSSGPVVEKISNNSQCAKMHNGDVLSKEQVITYGNVGFLQILDSDGWWVSICSAYLIRSNMVLTAQHCIADTDQNTYQARQVRFTFENFESIASALDKNIPYAYNQVAEIIPWAETGENYRDVALLRLEDHYNEMNPPFDLMQTAIPSNNAIITMSGYGNYANGEDRSTFSVSRHVIGTGKFNQYTTINQFPDFDNSNFIESADYLSVKPDTAGKNQMICQGDSGSAAFWEQGPMISIVGVTSMQDTSGDDEESACINSSEGLFVPSHKIRAWANQKLSAIDSKYAFESYSTMKAEVVEKISGPSANKIKVKLINFLDNGLGLAGEDFTFELCNTPDCAVKPTLYSDLDRDSIVLLKISSRNGVNYIDHALPENFKLHYESEIKATVVASETSSTNGGRSEKVYTLKYSDPVSSAKLAVPRNFAEIGSAIYCISGCSENTKISTVGFEMKEGKGIRASVSVIHGKIYLRSIVSEPSYDSDVVEATRAGMAPKVAIAANSASASCNP